MEAQALRDIDAVLITHSHHDHISGLPDLYDYARWTKRRVRVISPPNALSDIAHRYHWLKGGLEFEPLEDGTHVAGYSVHAWEVCHGKNGRSFAFRFTRPGYVWAYCPDSINLVEEERLPLRGLELLVLGTAYYDEPAPMQQRSLYSMVEALDLLADVQPRQAVFTHLSHGVNVQQRYALPGNVLVGRDGMELPLGQLTGKGLRLV